MRLYDKTKIKVDWEGSEREKEIIGIISEQQRDALKYYKRIEDIRELEKGRRISVLIDKGKYKLYDNVGYMMGVKDSHIIVETYYPPERVRIYMNDKEIEIYQQRTIEEIIKKSELRE